MDNSDKNIENRVRSHYESLSLDDEQLQTIMRSSAASPKLFRVLGGAMAACLILGSVFTVHYQTSIGERTDRTLQEAAMNHKTRLEMEFTSNEIANLDEQMALLPFNISLPSTFSREHKVIGTRYCTINGKLAAHVKLHDTQSNNMISLFMTNTDKDLEKLINTQRSIDGLDVQLWGERGLFYAMAKSSS